MLNQKKTRVFYGVALLCSLCVDATAGPALGTPFETDPAEPYLYPISPTEIAGAAGDSGGLVIFEEGGTLWGMPFDEAGEAVAPRMIEVSPSEPAHEYNYPSVAFGGGQYLVGWSLNGVAVQRVSEAGERIGETILLDDNGYYPSIAWDGSAFIVTWEAITDEGREIAWAKVGADGTVLINELVTDVKDATEPAMAFMNGASFMAWFANPETQSAGVYGVMVDSEGGADGVFQISTVESGYDVRVSSDGNRFLVAWRDGDSIFGRLVTAASEMTDVFEIAQGSSMSSLVVSFDGTNYGIVYKDYGETDNSMRFVRVSPNGERVGAVAAADILYSQVSTAPTLIPFAGGYYVGYHGEPGVMGVVTDEALSPASDPVGLSLLPHPQSSANLIFNGTDYIISFTDEREGEQIFSTHAVRVSQAGSVRETEAMHISDAEHRGSYAAIATLGQGDSVVAWYLWEESAGRMARVIHADGTLGEMVTLSEGGAGSISIAAHGDRYLVVAVDNSLSPDTYSAVGQFLDAAASPVGDSFELLTQTSYLNASIEPTLDGYLMFYRDGATYGVPIGPDGQSGESFTLAPASALVQTVVSDTQTLVVWSEGGEARYGQFYEGGQLIGEKFMITPDGTFGDAAWDGTRFVAVWEDSDDASYIRYIETTGEMSPIESLFEGDGCFGPKVSSNGAGQLLLSCTSYRDNFRTRRLANYLIGEPLDDPNEIDTNTDTDVVEIDTVDDVDTDTDSERIALDTDIDTGKSILVADTEVHEDESDTSDDLILIGIEDTDIKNPDVSPKSENSDDDGAGNVDESANEQDTDTEENNASAAADGGGGCSISLSQHQKGTLIALITHLLTF